VSPTVTTDAVSMLRPCSQSADERSPSPDQVFSTLTSLRSHDGLHEGSRTAQRLNSLPVAVVAPTVASSVCEPPVHHDHTKPMVVADSREYEETSPKSVVGNSAVEVVEMETCVKRLMVDERCSDDADGDRNRKQTSVSVQSAQHDVTSRRTADITGDTYVKQLSDVSDCHSADTMVIHDQYFSHPASPTVAPLLLPGNERESGASTQHSIGACVASVNLSRAEQDENHGDRRLASPTNRASSGVFLNANSAKYKTVPSSVDQSSRGIDSQRSTVLAHSKSEPTFGAKSHHSKDENSSGSFGCIVS